MSDYTKESLMPFGKHKGKPLAEVPSAYLRWLWDNGVSNEPDKPLHNYIKTYLAPGWLDKAGQDEGFTAAKKAVLPNPVIAAKVAVDVSRNKANQVATDDDVPF